MGHSHYGGFGYPVSYSVHHYHHDRDAIPEKTTIPAQSIVLCDTNATLCAPNTMPLCMNNGTLLCVSFPQVVQPCKDNTSINCVRTEIPCLNETDPNCNKVTNKTVLDMPCISSVNITGNFNQNQSDTSANGTLVLNNTQPLDANTTSLLQNATDFCVTIVALPVAYNETAEKIKYEENLNKYYDYYIDSILNHTSYWFDTAFANLWGEGSSKNMTLN